MGRVLLELRDDLVLKERGVEALACVVPGGGHRNAVRVGGVRPVVRPADGVLDTPQVCTDGDLREAVPSGLRAGRVVESSHERPVSSPGLLDPVVVRVAPLLGYVPEV